jgi:hypothetical protein
MNHIFDGKNKGIKGIIRAIQWIGIKEWFQFSTYNKILATERDIYNWKTGN